MSESEDFFLGFLFLKQIFVECLSVPGAILHTLNLTTTLCCLYFMDAETKAQRNENCNGYMAVM